MLEHVWQVYRLAQDSKSALEHPNMVWETRKWKIFMIFRFSPIHIFDLRSAPEAEVGTSARGSRLLERALPKKYSISASTGSWASNRCLNPSENHHTQLF